MRVARFLILAVLFVFGATTAMFAQPIEHACDAAAAQAESDWNVPQGVLSAVGTVESGRQPGPLGAAPWPWTINAAGRGLYFETKDEAIAAVLGLMQRGYPYIDIGCFQIDIAYHPDMFRSLEDAFDPRRNAQAAARLLAMERAHAADWATAVARYHSATPERGEPYLRRVRAALPSARTRGENAQHRADSPSGDAPLDPVPGSGREDRRGHPLPTVIYPPALPRYRREPQIVIIRGEGRLPIVLVNEVDGVTTRR